MTTIDEIKGRCQRDAIHKRFDVIGRAFVDNNVAALDLAIPALREFTAIVSTDIPLLIKALELACAENLTRKGGNKQPDYWLSKAQEDSG